MEKKSLFTLFPKLLIAMLIVALLPVTGLWYITYVNDRQNLQTNVERNLGQALDDAAVKVNRWIETNTGILTQNAQLPSVQSLDSQQQKPVLEAIVETYSWLFLGHTVAATDGNNIARSDDKAAKYYGDREYFKQVLEQGKTIGQQVLISRTNGKPALILSAPVLNDQNERAAILAIGATLADISSAVADIKIGETGFAFLIDAKGRVVAHGRPEQISQELQDFSTHPAVRRGRTLNELNYDDNGKQVVARTATLGLDWLLVVQQDYDEAFAPLKTAQQDALLILGITVVGVLLVAFIVARRMAKPIRKLTAVADAYSRGELDIDIPSANRGDEIGALAQAIERMGTSLKMAITEITQRKAA